MLRIRATLCVLVIFLTGSDALTTEVIEPIVEEGDEVALVFVPASFIGGEQYRKTAQAIQAASSLRLWVALTKDYFLKVPDTQQVPEAVEAAIKDLKAAGMKSKTYVGVGHGTGGYFLHKYGKGSTEMKAIVLMGSSLLRDNELQEYPLPVLTLAAELDGITRITRIAEEFGKLKGDMLSSFTTLYRTPVLVIEGSNHAQFASGDMPIQLSQRDLIPDITEDDARDMIAKYVNNFLTATFSSSPSKVHESLGQLENAFSKSIKKLQPLQDMHAFDLSGHVSRWTKMAQEYIANEFADRIKITNVNTDEKSFTNSKPSITTRNDSVVVETKSYVHYKSKLFDLQQDKESPIEIRMKLKSKDAIWEALSSDDELDDGPLSSLKSEPRTCKSLNELALELALNHSSLVARKRYKERGRQLIFERDFFRDSHYLFSVTHQLTQEDEDGVHLRAIVFRSPITARVNPGMLYCTGMSPYSAMEWIYVDSLRKK